MKITERFRDTHLIKDLHTAGDRPDWEGIPEDQLNADQRLAKRTKGVLKLANFVTFAGFGLTIYAINEASKGHYKKGLATGLVGRSLDKADGWLAKKTGTIDPIVGEKLDSVLDTIALAYALIKFQCNDKISDDVAFIYAAQKLTITGLVLEAKRRGVNVKTSESGKINSFVNWSSLGLFVLDEGLRQNDRPGESRLAKIGGYALTATSIGLGAKAIWGYGNHAFRRSAEEQIDESALLDIENQVI